ncbi:MAG: hypothetical protein ACI4Q9_02240 [Candidatus Methanomethylophilaceae archaeon]
MDSFHMSVIDNVISFIMEQEGVVGVFEMDDEASREIDRIEKSVVTRTNHEYRSIGYELAMKRQHRLCVFYTNDFTVDMRSRLKLMSSDGTVMGTTLMRDEIDEYKERDDVLWVSDDFVVFPDVRGEGDEMFVLYPYEYKALQQAAEGCVDPIGISPTPSSDHYLKQRSGTPESSMIFSTIIAFDG